MPHHKMPTHVNGTGWDETSPASQRRNAPNYDDTSSPGWSNLQQGKLLKHYTFLY